MNLLKKKPAKVKALYKASKKISSQRRPYLFGGGHGQLYSKITAHQGLDCSGSCWYALRMSGMITAKYAPHSSQFGNLGRAVPGKGKWHTIYYNDSHVWIRFHGLGMYWRFDTSPWGSGGNGPRVRIGSRSTKGFKACHIKGY